MSSFNTLVVLSCLVTLAVATDIAHYPHRGADLNLYKLALEDDAPLVTPDSAEENEWIASVMPHAHNLMASVESPLLTDVSPDVLLQTFAALHATTKPKQAGTVVKMLSKLKDQIKQHKLQANRELNATNVRIAERKRLRDVNQRVDDVELKKAADTFQKAEAAREKEDAHEQKDYDERLERFESRQEVRAAEAKEQEDRLKDMIEAHEGRNVQRQRALDTIQHIRVVYEALAKKQIEGSDAFKKQKAAEQKKAKEAANLDAAWADIEKKKGKK
eukprot:GFYU01006117.1.p1 GENE.GFYU01006117.1~~GFYU01006117.1.p1  ORF type:complete len:274 (-),score=94.58 GFYU01006117.1:116-937(-)